MIIRDTIETPMMKLLKGLLPTVLSVCLGVGSCLVTMRMEMQGMTISVQNMKMDNEKLLKEVQSIKNKQDAFLEVYYLPKKEEWFRMVQDMQRVISENEDDRRTLQRVMDDVHRCMQVDTYAPRSRSSERVRTYQQ